MRRLLLVLVLSLPIVAPALAAASPTSAIVSMPTAPTVGSACSFRPLLVAESNGHMYRCVAGKWFDLTSQVLLEAQINAGTIDGDLTVKGRVVSPTAQVGKVDFTTEGYAPAAIQGSQGGFSAAVSEGPHIDWGLNDLQLGTYRPGGVVGLWSDTAVRIESPALTSGLYTTGGTLGTRTLPWTNAYISSLDLTADGTADLTSDGSGNVVLYGYATHPALRVPLPLPGGSGSTAYPQGMWTFNAYAGAGDWGGGTGSTYWVMSKSSPARLIYHAIIPAQWSSGVVSVTLHWKTKTSQTATLTAAYQVTARCSAANDVWTSYAGAVTPGGIRMHDNGEVSCVVSTVVPSPLVNCPAGGEIELLIDRVGSASSDTVAVETLIFAGRIDLW